MRRRSSAPGLVASPMVVGSVLLMLATIGVFLSYNASRGLPYVPTYDIKADVPDAAELVAGGSEVRLGGARIGLVDKVAAMPPSHGRPAYARLSLKLDKTQHGLPVDTHIQVRPRSVLGAKYVDVVPGHARRVIPAGGLLPLSQAKPIVEFDEAFDVFDDQTSRGLRGTVDALGDALAGRAADLNETLYESRRALPPLQRVLERVVAPRTDLRGFIRGSARAADAFAAAAPHLGGFIDGAARTAAALDAAGQAMPAAVAALPPAERTSTVALRHLSPVLGDATVLARALHPGTRRLPAAARALAAAMDDGTPVLRRTPPFADRFAAVLRVLGRVAVDPNTAGSLRQLLATVTSLHVTLDTLEPAQTYCNVGGLWARNYGGAFEGANSLGHFLSGQLVLDPKQLTPNSAPADDLHVNPTPNENASECEAGNEPYLPGQQYGNPPGDQKPKESTRTRPPAESMRLARKAGLLTPIAGAAR
jgi:virulence factor Mce-like protein